MNKNSGQGKNINRRSFVQGIAATSVMSVMVGAGLTACAPQPEKTVEKQPEKEAIPASVTSWVDAVSSASLSTNKYTNLTEAQLHDAIATYAIECTVASSNEDGTPNVAIFVPGSLDGKYITFGWAENQTRKNILERKIGVVAFDIPNFTAETKELRHQGAVAKVALVEDEAILKKYKEQNEKLAGSVILEIIELKPVG